MKAWRVYQYGNAVTVGESDGAQRRIADNLEQDSSFTRAEVLQHGHVMAAGPELLEALTAAVKRIELANTEGDPILSAWLSYAKAAIAKAEPAEG